MGKGLFLLFTVVPVLELWLFMEVGGFLGIGGTLALILTTGALGAFLARTEGLRVLKSWQGALAEGRLPEDGVVSSLLVLVGGALLITPGMLTDVVGFALLMPPSRRVVASWLVRFAEKRMGNLSAAGFAPSQTNVDVDFASAAEGAFQGAGFERAFQGAKATGQADYDALKADAVPQVGYVEKDDGEIIVMPPLDVSQKS
ncbi:MAG: FxsA family protein [Deltaproteobacteria bacterium]|nr:FxsA family protein [Deltaproteobacteria bacterium]